MAAKRLIVMLSGIGVVTVAYGQQNLAADPRLQAIVDVHAKRILVPELADFLKKHSNQKFAIEPAFNPLMVCVFAKQQPLWRVMRDVADVLGGEWKDLRSEWRLDRVPESHKLLDAYQDVEQIELRNRIADRAKALADFVQRHRWGSVKATPDPVADETPVEWASRHAGDPAFYVAGIMFRKASRLDGAGFRGSKLDCDPDFTSSYWPQAYTLVAPPSLEIADCNLCSAPDDSNAALAGAQIAVRCLPWAGDLQAVSIDGGSHRAIKPKNLIALPYPVGRLAQTKSGKSILDWETPLEESKDEVLDVPLPKLTPNPTLYAGGGRGIEEYLEALHDSTHVTIVSDAFRLSAIGKEIPTEESVRKWLTALRASEKCFVKVNNGSIMVRHGGFWNLRLFEPPEDEVRAFETKKQPDLIAYADFAVRLRQLPGFFDGPTPPFFDSQQSPLMKVTAKPLRDNFPALIAFGQLGPPMRSFILAGGVVNTANRMTVEAGRSQQSTAYLHDIHNRPVKYSTYWTDRMTRVQYWTLDVADSASYGVFYGGQAMGLENRALQSYYDPGQYERLWGLAPPDNDAEANFDFDMDHMYHARYLSLTSEQQKGIDPATKLEIPQYGTFKFFASVSRQDGVLNEVMIPKGD